MPHSNPSKPSDGLGSLSSPGMQKGVIALCCLAVFLDGYDMHMLSLVIPQLAEQYGVPAPRLAMAASLSIVGMALGSMLLSPYADRFGRRPTLSAFQLLVGLTSIGAIFAGGPTELAIWRFFTGLGLGAIVPVAIALAYEHAPPSHRTTITTIVVTSTPLGAMASGLIGPWVDNLWGWQGIFGVGVVAPCLSAALAWFFVRDAVRPEFPASGGVDARRSKPRALFQAPLRARTLTLALLFWINLFVNIGISTWLPTLLMQSGWDRAFAMRISGTMSMGGIAGSLLISFLGDRGYASLAFAGAYLIGAAALTIFASQMDTKLVLTLGVMMLGIGTFGGASALGARIAHLYPADVRTTAVGLVSGFSRTGSFVGPLAVGAAITAAWTPAYIFGVLAIPLLCCAALVMLLGWATRRGAPEYGAGGEDPLLASAPLRATSID